MAASNAQVQTFVNDRIRPRCEQLRALLVSINDDVASIDDVYANLTDSPDWQDTRTDAPPSMLTPSDVLGIHAFMADLRTAINAHTQLPVVLSACVRPV